MSKLWINLFCFFLLPLQAAEHPKSIYALHPKVDAAVIAGGTLATVIPYGLFQVRRRCPCDPNEVNAFDRSAIGNNSAAARLVSDLLVVSTVTVPLAVGQLSLGWSQALLEDALVFAEVLAVNSALVTAAKYAVQRPVPLAYSGEYADRDEGYRSFYSGHTSTAFACAMAAAMTASQRYHLGAWPWIAATVVGGAVGVTRVLGGNHFPSDVLVGAVIGTGVGIAIPWMHRRQEGQEKVFLAPLGEQGAQLVWFRTL